ncbi:MAG: hypothetical protein AB1586_22350 [Pseudomonadota bacterium]|jgi:hypothetical protein
MVTKILKLADDNGRVQIVIASDRMQLQLLSTWIERAGLRDEADVQSEFRMRELEGVRFCDGLHDVTFRRSDMSDIELSGAGVFVRLTSRDAERYVALINQLVCTGRGHQYLDPENVCSAVELVISLGEFPE